MVVEKVGEPVIEDQFLMILSDGPIIMFSFTLKPNFNPKLYAPPFVDALANPSTPISGRPLSCENKEFGIILLMNKRISKVFIFLFF